MLKRIAGVFLSLTVLMFNSSSIAVAAFNFSDWKYESSNGGGKGVFAYNALDLTSPDTNSFSPQYVQFSSTIPDGADSHVNVPWIYKSDDVNGPYYDLPEFLIIKDGIVQTSGYLYYTGAGASDYTTHQGIQRIDIGNYIGSTLVFRLNARDDQLGSAYLTISSFSGFENPKRKACVNLANSKIETDKLCDGDGGLRRIVDEIDTKYGNLLK